MDRKNFIFFNGVNYRSFFIISINNIFVVHKENNYRPNFVSIEMYKILKLILYICIYIVRFGLIIFNLKFEILMWCTNASVQRVAF
jgi:hypothetical protein